MLKMIAASGFLTALECIKFVFGRVAGEHTALLQTPSWFKGGPTSKGEGRKGVGKRREKERRKERNTPSVDFCLRPWLNIRNCAGENERRVLATAVVTTTRLVVQSNICLFRTSFSAWF